MYPQSRGPPLPSSEAYAVRPQFFDVPAHHPPPPPPPSHTYFSQLPVGGCQSVSGPNSAITGSPSPPSTVSNVSLNIAGRLGQYRIEAPNVDQLVPFMT